MSCSESGCKRIAEYSCECSHRLCCAAHMITTGEHFGHRVESLYVFLDDTSASKIIQFISPIIRKLKAAEEACLKHSVQLISQIKQNTKQVISSLGSQHQYFSGLLKKIKAKTVKRNEFSLVWNALNSCGVKELLDMFEFGEELKVNPFHQYLKKTVVELAHAGEINQGLIGRYYEDPNFRESIQFLSELNQHQIKAACENANKVTEKIRVSSINNAFRTSDRYEIRFENQSTIDSLSNTFESSSSYSQEINFEDLSSFFTKEILVKVMKTHLAIGIKNTLSETDFSIDGKRLVKGREQIEIQSMSELINRVDVVGCLTNQEILNIFVHRLNLIEKCKIVKKFFLLGQGEIFHSFFTKLNEKGTYTDLQLLFKDSLESNHFSGVPKEILCGLTFQYDEESLEVNINYKFAYPLNVFFTEPLVCDLQSIFTCLWTLRKVENEIKTSFKHQWTALNDEETVLVYQKFSAFRYTCIVLINDLLYFIMEEVIEKAWKQLWHRINTSLNFEDSVLTFKETIGNIKFICGQSTKAAKNLRQLIKAFQDFSEFAAKFLKHLEKNKNVRSSHKKTLQNFPEKLRTVLISFISTLESLPYENISYFRSRLNEFSFIML